MNINEIRESGLLELYVLGELGREDTLKVERAIREFPSLKQDVSEIEVALQLYANANAVPAPEFVLDNVIKEISGSSKSQRSNLTRDVKKESMWTKLLPVASLIGLIGLSIALYLSKSQLDDQRNKFEKEIEKCENEKKEQNLQLGILQSLDADENRVIFAEATEKYPDTKLYFNSNSSTRKNYLQVEELPGLADNQSYQLWSLKGDNAPIPLDVFQDETGKFIELSFVSDTDAYAITIEPKGGQDTPTLENLVALIKIT